MTTAFGDVLPSAVEAIGDTPLVELARLTRGIQGRIFAKLEYLNPGFSKKDRIARQITDDAEAAGTLSRVKLWSNSPVEIPVPAWLSSAESEGTRLWR